MGGADRLNRQNTPRAARTKREREPFAEAHEKRRGEFTSETLCVRNSSAYLSQQVLNTLIRFSRPAELTGGRHLGARLGQARVLLVLLLLMVFACLVGCCVITACSLSCDQDGSQYGRVVDTLTGQYSGLRWSLMRQWDDVTFPAVVLKRRWRSSERGNESK